MKSENLKILLIFILAFLLGMAVVYILMPPKIQRITNTEYIKGDTVYIKKDTTIYITKKTTVFLKDSTKKVSSIDTVFYHNLDTISLFVQVEVDTIAEWFVNLQHKDYQITRIDTLKIYEPKEIRIKEELKFYEQPYFNFIAGIVVALLIAIGVK